MTRGPVRCVFALAVLSAFFPLSVMAQPAHHPVNLSLWYPVSTNRDPAVSTNFRLNVFYGHLGSIRGIDLSAGVAHTSGEMRGLQLAGLAAYAGERFAGVGLTGGVSFVRGDAKGVQVTGGVNYIRGEMRGAQWAGLFNFVEGDLAGAQFGAFFNLNNGDGRFWQSSAVANLSVGSFRGVQVAGGMNYVNERMAGVQVGLLSLASTLRGVQASLANFARNADGAQIGVFNFVRTIDGVPVGMINIADDGAKEWVTFGSSYAAVSTGLRTAVNGFYSMLTAGIGDLEADEGDTAFLSWHYGYAFPVTDAWSIDVDAGYVHAMPQKSDDPLVNDETRPAVQFRALADWRVNPRLLVFAGGGISILFSEYASDADSETKPLFVAGLSLF